MTDRPLLRMVGIAALTLLFTTSLATLPAAAAAGTAAPAAGSPAVSPQLLAAMRTDLDLSAEQADRRLAADAAAASTAEHLRAELGDSFAGAWLHGSTLVVASTDASAGERIRAAGAQPHAAAHSEGELDDVLVKLDGAAPTAAASVGSWYVDVASNSVVVATTDMPAARAFVGAAGADADPVRIRMVRDRPRPFADLVGGQAIVAQAGGRCSIGFSARSASSAYVLTAGHCTELGGNWNGANGTLIGPVAASDFPTDDFGAIRVSNTAAWTPTNEVAGSTPVTGSTEAAVGAAVCRSGSTTGFRCGTILSRNATVNYGDGAVVRGLTRTDACAEPGDSGGSFVSGAQAQGLTSGGSGSCATGGETFFQPIDEVLDRYGLTLVTS
jgi:streptogrisin C